MHLLSVAIALLGSLVLQSSACMYDCSRYHEIRVTMKDNGELVEEYSANYCPADLDFIIKGKVTDAEVVSEEHEKWGTLKTVEYTVKVDQVFKDAGGSLAAGTKLTFRESYRIRLMLPSCGDVHLRKDTDYLLRGKEKGDAYELANVCRFGIEWTYVEKREAEFLATKGC